MIRGRYFVFLCGLLLVCRAVSAEVYKWVDENGKVQFSDHAPPDKKAQDISSELQKTNVDHASPSMSAAAGSHEKTEDEKNLERRRKQELEASIGQRCRKMKADIGLIARGERAAFIGADGKEEFVLERDRDKKLAEWKAGYEKTGCNKLYPLE